MLLSAFSLASCSGNDENGEESGKPITITLEVIGPDGSSKEHSISTDTSKNLRQALENAGLISGEEGAYGLYVKVVDGERLDYDTDGKYWAFYVDGAYALLGVDSTEIEAGKVYSFVAE